MELVWCLILSAVRWPGCEFRSASSFQVSVCIGGCKKQKKRGSSLAALWCSLAFQRAVLILAESARCGFIAYLTHGMHRAARWWFIRSHSIRALHLSFGSEAHRGIIGAQSNSVVFWESENLPGARRILRDPVTASANRLLIHWKGNILQANTIQAS